MLINMYNLQANISQEMEIFFSTAMKISKCHTTFHACMYWIPYIFWDVTSPNKGTHFSYYLTLRTEAPCSSKTAVTIYQLTQCDIPEDLNKHQYQCLNLQVYKPQLVTVLS
jgi:hypothetical protein